MTALAGTGSLTRFILRRDRVRLAVWVLAVVALVAVSAASVKGLYPTQADLDQAAIASESAAAIAFNGPAQSLDTLGGQVAFQIGAFGLVLVGLMSLLLVGRMTRGEEEAGRDELLRALPVGRHAPTTAAMLVVAGTELLVGVSVALALLGAGLPMTGSVVFGSSYTVLGLLFAGVALLAAQVTDNTRVTYGIAGAVLGAAFLIRAVGDVNGGTLSWLSPIGWSQKARPFAGEQWWPLLLAVLATAGLVVAAAALTVRRDIGSGLFPPRRGRAVAATSLGSPLGLATRLLRGSLGGWSLVVVSMGVAYGSIAETVQDFVDDNEVLADMIARAGGASVTESYLATSFRIVALLGAAYAVQAVARLRTEEVALRAEPVLATPVSRYRWAMSHVLVALGGAIVLLVVAGLSVGLSYGLTTDDVDALPRLLLAALAYTPAVGVLVGLALAAVGWAPNAIFVPWGLLSYGFVAGLLGGLFNLPGWLLALSPFEDVPLYPAADLEALPLVALTSVAVALTGAGLVGLRRRDIVP